MISRNLIQRLEQLESRVQQEGEPMMLSIRFVAPDGRVVDQITVGSTDVKRAPITNVGAAAK
jgi:hypothetical protein